MQRDSEMPEVEFLRALPRDGDRSFEPFRHGVARRRRTTARPSRFPLFTLASDRTNASNLILSLRARPPFVSTRSSPDHVASA